MDPGASGSAASSDGSGAAEAPSTAAACEVASTGSDTRFSGATLAAAVTNGSFCAARCWVASAAAAAAALPALAFLVALRQTEDCTASEGLLAVAAALYARPPACLLAAALALRPASCWRQRSRTGGASVAAAAPFRRRFMEKLQYQSWKSQPPDLLLLSSGPLRLPIKIS